MMASASARQYLPSVLAPDLTFSFPPPPTRSSSFAAQVKARTDLTLQGNDEGDLKNLAYQVNFFFSRLPLIFFKRGERKRGERRRAKGGQCVRKIQASKKECEPKQGSHS
jgi:hypothetical protein